MNDLINRLRKWGSPSAPIINEAADALEAQAKEIAELKEKLLLLWGAQTNISVVAERDKFKALCDQMGDALETMFKEAQTYGEAWAKCYVDDFDRAAVDSKELRFKLLNLSQDRLRKVPEALAAWRATKDVQPDSTPEGSRNEPAISDPCVR